MVTRSQLEREVASALMKERQDAQKLLEATVRDALHKTEQAHERVRIKAVEETATSVSQAWAENHKTQLAEAQQAFELERLEEPHMIQRAIDAARGAARAITLKAVEKAQREAQALLTEFEQERRVTLDEASAAKATALANVWPQAQMRTENKPQVQAQLEVIKHEMLTAAIEREEKYELEKMETAIAHAGRELTKAVELAQASAMLQVCQSLGEEYRDAGSMRANRCDMHAFRRRRGLYGRCQGYARVRPMLCLL